MAASDAPAPTGPLVHRAVHHGALLILAGSLIFIAGMIVTQLGWTTPYSLLHNYISDLGAVHCQTWSHGYVCSPWHDVFNATIIVLGIFVILGVLLISSAFPPRGTRTVGLGLLAIAGLGSIGVGLFPEDVNLGAHTISAAIAFIAGNLGLIVLSLAMFRDTRWDGYRSFTLFLGLIGLVALVLFELKIWGALGVGGMERLIVAPLLLWMIVAAIHLLRVPAYAPRILPKSSSS